MGIIFSLSRNPKILPVLKQASHILLHREANKSGHLETCQLRYVFVCKLLSVPKGLSLIVSFLARITIDHEQEKPFNTGVRVCVILLLLVFCLFVVVLVSKILRLC